MEEDGWGYGGGAQAGLQNQNTYVQLLRRSETRYKRMAKVLAVALVLVLAGTLPLLLTVLLGRQHVPPDSQPTMPPARLSDIKPEILRHEDPENPSAMLTAPKGNNTNGLYLQWAHDFGIAYCHGGFNYSNGDLVVPRNGLYSVFLQITYRMECPGHMIKLMNKVLHVTEEYRKDMTLLSSSHTMSCSKDIWSKSLYTAGLFFQQSNMVVVWRSGAALLLQDQGDIITDGAMNSALYQKILKENVRSSGCTLKLKHTWIMQQDKDMKHTSQSICEWPLPGVFILGSSLLPCAAAAMTNCTFGDTHRQCLKE